MGIITEELKPTRTMIDDTEFVRAKSNRIDRDSSMELVFGRSTLALSEKCIFYRTSQSGQRSVTIIPFKSVDSFSVQTRKFNLLLVVGVVMVLLAVGSGLWLLSSAAPGQPFGFP